MLLKKPLTNLKRLLKQPSIPTVSASKNYPLIIKNPINEKKIFSQQ